MDCCFRHIDDDVRIRAGSGIGQRLEMDADPVSLDPHVQLSGGMLQYSHWVSIPWSAGPRTYVSNRAWPKWERIDDLTMRFYLRKGVKFHSGNPFTAKDVKFTVDRIKKAYDFKGLFEPFEGVKIVDDYTVDIDQKPYACC
jgi:peptide/nickel transport system substrate-binding protein